MKTTKRFKTADGVDITKGMTVWAYSIGGGAIGDFPAKHQVNQIVEGQFCWNIGLTPGPMRDACECWASEPPQWDMECDAAQRVVRLRRASERLVADLLDMVVPIRQKVSRRIVEMFGGEELGGDCMADHERTER